MLIRLEAVVAGVIDSAVPRVDEYIVKRVMRVLNNDLSYEGIMNLDDREVIKLVLRSLRGYHNLHGAGALEDLGISSVELDELEETYPEL